MMIGMYNHLRNARYLGSMLPFSEGEPGSLDQHENPFFFVWEYRMFTHYLGDDALNVDKYFFEIIVMVKVETAA